MTVSFQLGTSSSQSIWPTCSNDVWKSTLCSKEIAQMIRHSLAHVQDAMCCYIYIGSSSILFLHVHAVVSVERSLLFLTSFPSRSLTLLSWPGWDSAEVGPQSTRSEHGSPIGASARASESSRCWTE